MARWYLSARGDSTARGRGRTNVNVVYDVGGLDVSDPALAAMARADAAHGQRLSRTTLERIMCDCYVSRVITDGRSNILDVGRLTRTVSNALWTALIVRDGHCTEKGCTLGPGHCEAHHVLHWEHGGPTDLDNLVLLCWYHHKQRHIRDAKRGKRSAHSRRTVTERPPAPGGAPGARPAPSTEVAHPRT
jgi:HNH endonuclease